MVLVRWHVWAEKRRLHDSWRLRLPVSTLPVSERVALNWSLRHALDLVDEQLIADAYANEDALGVANPWRSSVAVALAVAHAFPRLG